MAPYAGPSPQQVVRMLREPDVERRLPLSMGGPAGPTAQVGLREGRWCLYRLVTDDEAFGAFANERWKAKEPLFPEHRMQFLVPGEILVAADSRTELVAALERVELWLDEGYELRLGPR
jgi:hypothetical protein